MYMHTHIVRWRYIHIHIHVLTSMLGPKPLCGGSHTLGEGDQEHIGVTITRALGGSHTLGQGDQDHIRVNITRALGGGGHWSPLYKGHEDHIGVSITRAMVAQFGFSALHNILRGCNLDEDPLGPFFMMWRAPTHWRRALGSPMG